MGISELRNKYLNGAPLADDRKPVEKNDNDYSPAIRSLRDKYLASNPATDYVDTRLFAVAMQKQEKERERQNTGYTKIEDVYGTQAYTDNSTNIRGGGASFGGRPLDEMAAFNTVADNILGERYQKYLEENKKKYQNYMALAGSDDFGQFSHYTNSQKENADGTHYFTSNLNERVNKNPELQEGYDNPAGRKYQNLTDEEVAVFNYLYNKEGPEAAQAFVDSFDEELNARTREEVQQHYAEQAKDEGWLATGAKNVLTSPAKVAGTIGNAINYATRGGIDQNAWYNSPSYISKARDEAVMEDMSGAGKFFYQTGESIGNFLFNALISAGVANAIGAASGVADVKKIAENLSLALMSSQASNSTIVDLKDQGYSDSDAVKLAIISGFAEFITEKYSVEALMNMDSLHSSKMLYWLKNAFTEGSEEVASDAINLLGDIIVMKDKSQWEQKIRQYEAQGYTRAQATGLAIKDQALESGASFLGGFLSGGVMAGGVVGGSSINAIYQGNQFKQANGNDALMNLALEGQYNDVNSAAYRSSARLQNTLEQGRTPSALQVGNVLQYQAQANAEQDISNKILYDAIQNVNEDQNITTEDAKAIRENQVALQELRSVTPDLKTTFEGINEAVKNYVNTYEGAIESENKQLVRNLTGQGITTNEARQASRRALGVDVEIESANRIASTVENNTPELANLIRFGYNDIVNSSAFQSTPGADFAEAMVKAYNLGTEGKSAIELTQDLSQNAAGYISQAQKMGVRDAEGGIDEGSNGNYNEQSRYGSAYSGQQAGIMAQGRGSEIGRRSAEREIRTRILAEENGREVNAESIISDGNGSVTEITAYQKADKAAVNVAVRAGIKEKNIHLFKGGKMNVHGVSNVQAFTNIVNGERQVWVQADNPTFPSNILMKHESMHAMIAAGKYSVDNFKSQMKKNHAEDYDRVMEYYKAAYASTGMSEDDLVEEMMCDAYANMNIFTETARETPAAFINTAQSMPSLQEGVANAKTSGKVSATTGTKTSSAPVIRIEDNAELAEYIKQNSDKDISRAISDYLFDRFKNYTFEMSDGIKAIVDHGDTKKLSNNLSPARIAELGNLKELVETAVFDHEDTATHRKFSAFRYYGVSVQYGKDTYPLWVNVGKEKFNSSYHIYAITKRGEAPANQGTSGLFTKNSLGFPIRSASPNEKLSQKATSVKQNLETHGADLIDDSAVKTSLATWTETDKNAVLNSLTKAGFAKNEAQRWIDDVNTVSAMIAADQYRLDYDAADNQVMLKNNDEYVKTLDASTLCAKRLLYQGTFNRITELLPNTILMPDDLIHIRKVMADLGDTVPCGICYVESRRKTLSKFAGQWLNEVYKGHIKVTMNDLTSTDGLEKLRKKHPGIYDDYTSWMRRRGTANPKIVELRTAYRGDIAKLTNGQIDKITRIGGLRVQSFSDFETVHLIDMMQAVLDMSAKKLTSQAYTKVPNFAWAFGDTGIKINLSLIGKAENGKLVFDPKEGMPIEDAMKLRDRYSENVGTILVGANDESILLAMADDRIDFIIPFHRSGWSKDQFEALGLSGYDDYQNYQNERNLDGSSIKEGNLYPIDYWDYSKTGKENAERYLEICKEQKRIPKFEKFLVDNGDGSWSLQPDGSTDGYWKMLIDFKMYNNEGIGVPQRTVTPTFNMAECERILNEYNGEGNRSLPVDEKAAKKFAAEYKKAHKGAARFSRATDTNYMSAVQSGDMLTAQRMVDEAAQKNGYELSVYHGTGEYFNTFRMGAEGIHLGNIDQATQVAINRYETRSDYTLYKWGQINGKIPEMDNATRQNLVDYAYALGDYYETEGTENEFPFNGNLSDTAAVTDYVAKAVEGYAGDGRDVDKVTIRMHTFDRKVGYNVMHLYAKMNNPFIINGDLTEWTPHNISSVLFARDQGRDRLMINGEKNISGSDISLNEEQKNTLSKISVGAIKGDKAWDALANVLEESGYDGIQYLNQYEGDKNSYSYIALRPSDVKSADPVTYDNKGNIIPLSKRFNKESNDIRFSRALDIDGQLSISDLETYYQEKYENVSKANIKTAARATKGVIERIKDFQNAEVQKAKDNKVLGNVRTIALGITSEFIKTGYIDFSGLKLDSDSAKAAGQIAAYSMILRNPNFETFRILYTKGDHIVGNTAVTSYNVDTAYATLDKDVETSNKMVLDQMRRLGADGYYLMHNHPSGDVSYSPQDKQMTAYYKKNINGLKGHIIIDHNKYGFFDATNDIRYSAHDIENGTAKDVHKRSIDSPVLYRVITGPDSVADIAKDVVHSNELSTLIYAHKDGVRAVQEVSNKFLTSNDFRNYVKNRKLDFGAVQTFLVTNMKTFNEVDKSNLYRTGIFTDVVGIGAEDELFGKSVYSMRELGRAQWRTNEEDKLYRVYEDKNKSTIKGQLMGSLDRLKNSETVCSVSYDVPKNASIQVYIDHALSIAKKWGYKFERRGFGVVVFDEKRIRKAFDYDLSDIEVAAFEAIPYVVRRGEQLDGHDNHKGRGYQTATFAGKVQINGKPCVLGVTVKQTGKNYYNVHRVLALPDDDLSLKVKEAEPTPGGGSSAELFDTPISSASNSKITQESSAVKTKMSREIDDRYAELAKDPQKNETELRKMVRQAAANAGYTEEVYHGTLSGGFTVFDKSYARVGGNSGAGFYTSTNVVDSENNYSEVEGADNYFKARAIADKIEEAIGEDYWEGPDFMTEDGFLDSEAILAYAKKQITKNPQTYTLYGNPGRTFIRDYRNSTNIYEDIMEDFDESVIDRDDYDSDEDYEDALYEAQSDYIYEQISEAVYEAARELEREYDVASDIDVSDIITELTTTAFDYGNLNYDDIQKAIYNTHDVIDIAFNDEYEDFADGTPEFARGIIEALGYDSITDREVSRKFNQVKKLAANMDEDTTHIIFFRPNQMKFADLVTYDNDGNVIPLSQRFNPSNNDIRYSRVTDPSEIKRLNSEKTVKVYRAMQVIDGELYPPMAAKLKDDAGKNRLVEPTELGAWYRADERPDLIKDGKFALNKGNGSTPLNVAYNPYWHTSRSMLNDQFSSAYKRPNLVTVECEVPESELTSGYKAEFAKDAVGEMQWHSGPVSSKLAKEGNPRRVILSRWVKVNRIVPDSEAAASIAKMLQGTGITIPENTVTPSLKEELIKQGVSVGSQDRFSRAPLPENADEEAAKVVDNLYRRASYNNMSMKYGNYNAAAYTDKRIEQEISYSYAEGSRNKDYARAYIAFVKPEEFIKATSSSIWRDQLYAEVKGKAKEEGRTSMLDLDALTNESQSMYLRIKTDENGRAVIDGHEGRHRMIGLEAEGYKYVPVIIEPREYGYPDGQSRYHTKPISSLYLEGQNFYEGHGTGFFAHDILPLSANYADIARDVFAGGNNVTKFSRDMDQMQILTDDMKKQYASMQAEVEKQTARAEHFKGETRLKLEKPGADRYQVSDSGLNKIEQRLKKDYSSNASIRDDLRKLVNDFMNGRVDYDGAFNMALYIGNHIVANSKELVSHDDEVYTILKDYLRKTRISVSPNARSEIADYEAFRRRNLSRIRLTNDGIPVDVAYQELQGMFGKSYFPEVIDNQADQLIHIEDVLRTLTPVFENVYSSTSDAEMAVEACAMDIMGTLLNSDEIGKVAPTFADRQKRRREKAVAELKAYYNGRLDSLRRSKDKRIQELKDSKQRYMDRKKDSEMRTKLLNIARRLQNKKLPAVQRQRLDEIIGDLDTISKSLTNKSLTNLLDLAEWYQEQMQDPDFISDPITEERLSRLKKRHIADMTQEEVLQLTQVLQNIENELAYEKKLIDDAERRNTYQLAEATIKDIRGTQGTKLGLAQKADGFFIMGALSGERAIRRMTGYIDTDPLYDLTLKLSEGQRNMIDFQRRAAHSVQRFTEDKAFVESITGKKAKAIRISGMMNGERVEVDITPAERISLYLHSKNDANLYHIEYGGITVPDFKLLTQGKIEEAYNESKAKTIKLRPSEVRAITAQMTNQERAFAEAISEYFNGMSQAEINAVSEKLKGYSLAQVENYFPIETNKNFLKRDYESLQMDGTIEGMGFLKERVQKASTPIMLREAQQTMNQSVRMTSKYVGLAIPVRNFGKVMKVDLVNWVDGEADLHQGTIKQAIDQKWGKTGNDYIEKLIADLQNPYHDEDAFGALANKITSNYAGAVLEMNAGVAIKQAASYPTAMAVLGARPLVQALGQFGEVDLRLIQKYTPLQWYRGQGFSTTELGDMASGVSKNVPTFLKWIQYIDLLTTRKLWKASEIYVQQNNTQGLAVGTDDYYKEVARIYNKVIEETQPNYTVMQRPELLRSKNAITRALNMFKTQPYQNFGLLYDAVQNFKAKQTQYQTLRSPEAEFALKEARKGLSDAIVSQLLSALVFAIMQRLWDGFRGKSDKYRNDKGEKTLGSLAKGYALNILSTGFGMIPLGSVGLELIESATDKVSKALGGDAIFNQSFYGMDVPVIETLNGLMEGMGTVMETLAKTIHSAANGDDIDGWETVRKIYKASSEGFQAAGIPAQNVVNLGNAIAQNAAKVFGENRYMGNYVSLRIQGATNKQMYQNLYQAYQNDKAAYQELYNQMIADGYSETAIKNFFKKQ